MGSGIVQILHNKIVRFDNVINSMNIINLIEEVSKTCYPLEVVERRPHLTMELPYLFSKKDNMSAVRLRSFALTHMIPAIEKYMFLGHMEKMEPKKDFITVSKMLPGSNMGQHKDDLEENSDNFIAMFYINDNFSGGELFFPEINFLYKPVAGDIISYPAKMLHEVKETSGNERYSIGYGFMGPVLDTL